MFCFAANMVEPHLKDLSQRFQMHRDVKSLVECADDVSEHGPANDDSLHPSSHNNFIRTLNIIKLKAVISHLETTYLNLLTL